MRYGIAYKIEKPDEKWIVKTFCYLQRALMNTIFDIGINGKKIKNEFEKGFDVRLIIDIDNTKTLTYPRTLFENNFVQ